jgi:class I fructose-bisphosphate aldolase
VNIGKRIRLNRLFSHPSGRLCSVAVDHLLGYDLGMPPGLRQIGPTLAALAAARPDAITMHKGIAAGFWEPHAGRVPLVLQTTMMKPDDSALGYVATPEDAVRHGADALAIAGYVRGATEARHLQTIADCVREASRFDLPIICHIYPRTFADGTARISFAPEDIAWAVRCVVEMGVDVVKVPYCGDRAAYAQIVAECPVPLVAAGGPQTATLEAALAMMAEVVASGARGATIGRNIWGHPKITAATLAFKAVIHDGLAPAAALRQAGL